MSTSTTSDSTYDLIENPIFEVEVETTFEDSGLGSPLPLPSGPPGVEAVAVAVTPTMSSSPRRPQPLPPTDGMYEKIVYIDRRHARYVKYVKITDKDTALTSGQFEPVDVDENAAANGGGGVEVRRSHVRGKHGGKQLYDPKFILMWGLKRLGSSLKPYVCPVPSCKKAYKNSNGIRYHARYGHSATSDSFYCFCGRFYATRSGYLAHQKHSHKSVYRRNMMTSGQKVGMIKTKSAASKANVIVDVEAQRQQQDELDDLEIELFMNTVGENEAVVEEFGDAYDEEQERRVKMAIQRSMGDAFFELERNRNQNKENENEDMLLDSVQEFIKLESGSPELMKQPEVEEEGFDQTLYTPKYILQWGLKKRGYNPTKPYDCPVPNCKKAYKNANGIKYHSKFGHTRQKEFKCDCGRTFMTSYGYISHLKSVHVMPTMTMSVKNEKLLAPIFQNGQSKDAPTPVRIQSIAKMPEPTPLLAQALVQTLPENYGEELELGELELELGEWSFVGNINGNLSFSEEDFQPVYIEEELHSNFEDSN